MIYIVLDITNYGDGVYVDSYHTSMKSAKARLHECEILYPSGEDDNGSSDSWRIIPVEKKSIGDKVF